MKITEIKKIVKKIFIKHNLTNKHSEICTEYLIKAELVGAPSHGLARLKMYCERIKKKQLIQEQTLK